MQIAYSGIQTKDNGYALIGFTNSSGAGENDIWFVKVNSDGVFEWSKTYGGPYNDAGYCVVETTDGGM